MTNEIMKSTEDTEESWHFAYWEEVNMREILITMQLYYFQNKFRIRILPAIKKNAKTKSLYNGTKKTKPCRNKEHFPFVRNLIPLQQIPAFLNTSFTWHAVNALYLFLFNKWEIEYSALKKEHDFKLQSLGIPMHFNKVWEDKSISIYCRATLLL